MIKEFWKFLGKWQRDPVAIVKRRKRTDKSIDIYWLDYPAQEGRIKGRLAECLGEVYVASYSAKKVYRTFNEYREWVGMVVEAEIEEDEDDELIEKKVGAYSVAGWAYQIYVRSVSDGKLYVLPAPETMITFTGNCRCAMCMGSLVEAPEKVL
jgi:hypothetical protein